MANYPSDSDLMREVKNAGASLTKAALWSTKTPLDMANSFLLEMYLLFRLCDDLQANYTVEYVKGIHPNEHTFPQAASNKAGWPKFIVKDASSGKLLFQICAGTRAGDIHGAQHAIDVSIQTAAAGDTPGPDDVLQIFDAKYRSNSSHRISKHEFSEFVRWVELFKLRGAGTTGLMLNSLTSLDGNCLVTNGEPSTEPDAECHRTSVREVTKFHPNETLRHRP
ncbi:hypothetical protein LOC67_10655 [Stieleria sp. JC731]|uniref:hypothetical protein n=1 Tax=Pirellulaceae TaxID=2691357 RepID=UPI001E404951|nr:hypothetical protein [Stieleria sp. JC731]MCC9601005.1 hypothetical protein [Stieleria sp. JC731]